MAQPCGSEEFFIAEKRATRAKSRENDDLTPAGTAFTISTMRLVIVTAQLHRPQGVFDGMSEANAGRQYFGRLRTAA